MKRAEFLIIMPTFNEAENIAALVRDVLDNYPDFDLLIVDDNSPDGTGDIADQLSSMYNGVHVLHRARKLGLGPAYIAGFQWGLAQGYQYLLEMDCDFSHHPSYLPTFRERIADADLVIGSRYVRGGGTANWGLIRRLISSGGNLFTRVLLGLETRDCTSGFRCYRRDLLAAITWSWLRPVGYAFQIGLVYLAERKGFAVAEFPIIFEDRRVGISKMGTPIVIEAFLFVIRLALAGRRRRIDNEIVQASIERVPESRSPNASGMPENRQ